MNYPDGFYLLTDCTVLEYRYCTVLWFWKSVGLFKGVTGMVPYDTDANNFARLRAI